MNRTTHWFPTRSSMYFCEHTNFMAIVWNFVELCWVLPLNIWHGLSSCWISNSNTIYNIVFEHKTLILCNLLSKSIFLVSCYFVVASTTNWHFRFLLKQNLHLFFYTVALRIFLIFYCHKMCCWIWISCSCSKFNIYYALLDLKSCDM